MGETRRCTHCETELPDDAPAGLCPRCLVQAGFEDPDESDIQDSSADPAAAPTVKSPVGSARSFEPPLPQELTALFPQLEILKLIGQGGMGAVYQARQTKLDRLVALKIIRPESADDPAFAERFNREARTLARLSHPNIVAVHDFGEVNRSHLAPRDVPPVAAGLEIDVESKQPHHAERDDYDQGTLYYFLMEYVDGANLRELIQAGDLPPEQALAIVPQICQGLQFAHDAGIVHRDIKPENILVDLQGRVRIADFGLARLVAPSPQDFTLTATHQVMGTPRYMAPEQMEGSRSVDHRADIYSLGVVLYEMLTGEVPAGHFDPPSRKVAIDVRLDEVVLRALAREPERRFQHASELKSGVESISPGAGLQSAQGTITPHNGPGPSTILDREVIGAWRWVTGDPGTKPQGTTALPALLMTILSLAGCAMVMLPWMDLIVSDQSVTATLDGTQLQAMDDIPVYVRTYTGLDRWPGRTFAGAMVLLGLLALSTPSTRRVTWQRALTMTALASLAVLHLFLFKIDLVSGDLKIPGSNYFRFYEIEHRFIDLPGYYLAFGFSLAMIVLSGAAIRHAFAGKWAGPASAKLPGQDSGTPLANARFTVPAGDDIGSRIIFHFSGLGYEVSNQSPHAWTFRRGNLMGSMWSVDIREFRTTLKVNVVAGQDDELLVNCVWSVRKAGGWVSKRDIERLETEGQELKTLLRTGCMSESSIAPEPEPRVKPATGAGAAPAIQAAPASAGTSGALPRQSRNAGWPIVTLAACVVAMGLTFAPWSQSLLDAPNTMQDHSARNLDNVQHVPILASLHSRIIPAAELVQSGGRPRVRIGSVNLDYRMAFSVMADPRGMLNCWTSSLSFGDPQQQRTQPFVEAPNWLLFFVPLLIAGWGVLSARGISGPIIFRVATLVLAVFGMLHSGMVNCAVFDASETLQLPALLIFVSFCFVILATVGAGFRGVWRFGASLIWRRSSR